MPNRNGKRDHFAGGIGLLAAAVYLCLQGLKEVEKRLERKKKNNP